MTVSVAKSTSHVLVFKAYLASDHVSEATGKTIAITISKAGGAFGNPAAGATNATEISSGWYKVTLGTGDTDTLGWLAIRGAVATVDDVGDRLFVVNATNGGLTALPDTAVTTNASLITSGTGTDQLSVASGRTDLGKILGTAVSTPATAGILDVNVKNIDNDAASASGTVTFPNATLASTTNITAGTITLTAAYDAAKTAATQTSVDTIDGIVDAILVDTAEIGAAGAGLSAIPWNAAWDAEVQSEATDALNAYDPPTKAELDTAVANVSVDEIQASALADLFNTDSGTTYASAVPGSVVAEIADNAGGAGLTAADIADAVWDEATAGHTTGGTFGEQLKADVDAILADTNELQTDWVNGGRLDLILDARASQTSVDDLPTNAELATALGTEYDAVLTAINDLPTNAELTTALGTADDAVLAQVALVKAQTDKLTFDGANHIVADTRKISTSSTAADNLEAGSTALVPGTCAAGSTTTSVVTNLTEATDDHYNGRVISFISGDLAGQTTSISDYNGTTKTLTVVALTEAAADGDSFVIS